MGPTRFYKETNECSVRVAWRLFVSILPIPYWKIANEIFTGNEMKIKLNYLLK